MPPATRREVRLSASLPHPPTDNDSHTIQASRSANFFVPNMESILENFEHFKRKHISQNREIIKANALAQTRMRELENRIHTLEAEKVQKEIETVGLTAQLTQLRHAIACIHAGWQAIGRGLTLGLTHQHVSFKAHNFPTTSKLPPSNRVKVEPHPNASAVVKHIAAAPEGHIQTLAEEASDAEDNHRFRQQSFPNPVNALSNSASTSHQQLAEWQQQFKARRAAQIRKSGASSPLIGNTSLASALNMDDAPSPMASPELPAQLQDVIVAASASRSDSHHWSLPHVAEQAYMPSAPFETQSEAPDRPALHERPSRQSLRRSGRKSTRRQSGYISHHDYADDYARSQSPENESASSSAQPSSDPFLPSEANSEAMEGVLVYPGHNDQPPPQPPLTDITNGRLVATSSRFGSASPYLEDHVKAADTTPRKPSRTHSEDGALFSHHPYSTAAANPPPSEARTPDGRKRKVPAHEPHDPMPTPARLFSAAIQATPSAHVASDATADMDSETQTGRTRRVRKSINYALPKLNTKMRKPDPSDLVPASTPHRSHSNTPASARSMVGSTGNLSDIRKLHEAAALRQSPAERTSNIRSKGSPSRSSGELSRGQEEGGVRMADLFEIRQHASALAHRDQGCNRRSNSNLAFWSTDGVTDTSDDESRVTSNADLGELAELEAAMSDLCTADEGKQVDTPRAPQPSMWPSRSAAQISASSSTDSIASCSSTATSNATESKRPSLRRKTTPLPSRSRQSSVEQAMQVEAMQVDNASDHVSVSDLTDDTLDAAILRQQKPSSRATPPSDTSGRTAATTGSTKATMSAQSIADTKKAGERSRTVSSAFSSTVLGNGRPPVGSSGLAAGMKPKQRPASAGAALVGSRSVSATSGVTAIERPRTFSGTTAANAGLAQSASGNVVRPTTASSMQRASLRSALTNQTKSTPGQITPRIGAKGLPLSTTPASKDSPRLAGTPILRSTLSTSSLASESSGRSSPALSTASSSSTSTQLSITMRTSLKTQPAAMQQAKMQRPGTASSTASATVSSREGLTPQLNRSATGMSVSRPHPARSMPSLRRATEKTGVTSTPRITVRSSSSTLPAAAGGASGASTAISAATIAASKVAKAISSTPASRAREASATAMGLGIDFSSTLDENPAGEELINLTDKIHQVLQSSSSSVANPSLSCLSSEAQLSSPTTACKTSSDDASTSAGNVAKARRTSRRVSGMTA
ncbi:uncharacterized protein UDID_06729 [Ustilago sp. UG-2017a]|nr:uncharacterized protein UDID_06729 [Ustilago sp. UG-2017a]